MSHLALYRKWRPQRFSEVVGQEHISRTLINAMRLERLSHAYLFCGPRGTGKTTSARLLAKALNCQQPQDGEPCNQCQNCLEITQGHSLDVIEIDAASNRGIDSARELREQVRFSSSSGRYRVFIIDEFHMLTKEAFNALLKTLEEPPENVIFVLATTEPHEVLQTIVSRCQRFDFQRISTAQMTAHLQQVATTEQIAVSAAALEAMARKANGGLRDALSLLDQVQALALPGEALPDSLVYRALGLVEEQELLAVLKGIFAGSAEQVLSQTRALLEQGHDAMQVVAELIQLLRHLTLASLSEAQLESLGVPSHLTSEVRELGQSTSSGQIVTALETLLRTSDRLHKCAQPDVWLEADLLCLCLQAEPGLLLRLEQLERGQPRAGRSLQAPQPHTEAPRGESLAALRPLALQDSQPAYQVAEAPVSQPPTVATPQNPFPVQQTSSLPLATPGPATPPVTPPVPPNPRPAAGDPWQAFLEEVKIHQKPVIGFLLNGELVEIDRARKTWVLAFKGKFQRERIQKKLADGSLQALISQVMGEPYDLEVQAEYEKKNNSNRLTPSVLPPDQPPQTQAAPRPLEPPAAPVAPIPASQTAPATVDVESSFEPDESMIDMDYLPDPPPEESDFSLKPPLAPAEPAQLQPRPAKPVDKQLPEKPAVADRAPHAEISPAQKPSALAPEPSTNASVSHQHLQEVADLFKGKIVEARKESPAQT